MTEKETSTILNVPNFGLIVRGETLVPLSVLDQLRKESIEETKLAIREWVAEDAKQTIAHSLKSTICDPALGIYNAVSFVFLMESYKDLRHWETQTVITRKTA